MAILYTLNFRLQKSFGWLRSRGLRLPLNASLQAIQVRLSCTDIWVRRAISGAKIGKFLFELLYLRLIRRHSRRRSSVFSALPVRSYGRGGPPGSEHGLENCLIPLILINLVLNSLG